MTTYEHNLLYGALKRRLYFGDWSAKYFLKKHNNTNLITTLNALMCYKPWMYRVHMLDNGDWEAIIINEHDSKVIGVYQDYLSARDAICAYN